MSIRCYRHAGPNGPEDKFFSPTTQARDRPSRYGEGRDVRRTVARGPVLRIAWPPCCRCANRFFVRCLFRSFRTYMSIEKRIAPVFKVRKDLNNEAFLRGRGD